MSEDYDFFGDFNELDLLMGSDVDDDGDVVLKNEVYFSPKPKKHLHPRQIAFENAQKMADEMDFSVHDRYDCLITGNFVFGDFIEAFLVSKKIQATKMHISTLSMSASNVISLGTLLEKRYCLDLTLMVSDYFFSHERNKLIKLIRSELDKDEFSFRLVSARTHTKIVIFTTNFGDKFVIHGSANLRSSDNIEQFTIEKNEGLYEFYLDFIEKTAKRYIKTKKSVTSNELRDIIL